jgi:hypothetical protein
VSHALLARTIFHAFALSQRERTLWTAASFCLPTLLVLSIAVTSNGFVAHDKYIIFTLILAVVPLCGFAFRSSHGVVTRLTAPASQDLFICLNLASLLVLTPWLGSTTYGEALPRLIWIAIVAAYITTLCGALALVLRFTPHALSGIVAICAQTLIVVTPVVFAVAVIFPVEWLAGLSVPAAWTGAAFAASVCVTWLVRSLLARRPSLSILPTILAWIGPLASAILVLDVQLDYDALHYTAYLAPAAAVAGGRVPLLDVFCQYGQPYLLYNAAFVLLPPTFHTAALTTALINVLYTVGFIIVLRALVADRVIFFLLGSALPAVFFLQYSINRTPSLGGIRYLPVILLGAALVRVSRERYFSPFSIAALLLCWAWSLEAAIYGSFVYLAFVCAAGVTTTSTFLGLLSFITKALATLLLWLGLFVIAVIIVYEITTGQLPRYDLYLSEVLAYVGPDPFMDYNFFRQGFFTWAPILVGFFIVPCWMVMSLTGREKPANLPRITVAWALAVVFSVYCLLSTQPLYILTALFALLVLLIGGLSAAVEDAGGRKAPTVSFLSLSLVFTLVFGLLSGTAGYNFARPPAYATQSTSMLAELVFYGRPWPEDFFSLLKTICHPGDYLTVGNVCTGDTPTANPHYPEFAALVREYQGERSTIFAFHPSDALMNAALQKPNRLPVTFPYVDGFSPQLFRHIVQRSEDVITNDLRSGETVIITRDIETLNELQWALLSALVDRWDLVKVKSSEHFDVFELRPLDSQSGGNVLHLPERPLGHRNQL